MKIPTFNPKGIKPWMLKYPLLARLVLLLVLPVAPFVFAGAILWENRRDFSEIISVAKAVFLPWKVSP